MKAENRAESFAPLVGNRLHTLFLGTVPGRQSISQQQYYAHPRNAFWPIVCAIIDNLPASYDVHQQLSYSQRCRKLVNAGYGAWDVLALCERQGSLDSNIMRHSEKPNEIAALLSAYPDIRMVACNGRTAHKLFIRHIKAQWVGELPFRLELLPSSSPAMASLSLTEKVKQWQSILNGTE